MPSCDWPDVDKLMTYSKSLAERIRHLVSRRRGITDKKMFGGVCFLLNGNILVEEAIAEIIVKMGLKKLPLLPSDHTMHLLARAAVAVYEAAIENQRQE